MGNHCIENMKLLYNELNFGESPDACMTLLGHLEACLKLDLSDEEESFIYEVYGKVKEQLCSGDLRVLWNDDLDAPAFVPVDLDLLIMPKEGLYPKNPEDKKKTLYRWATNPRQGIMIFDNLNAFSRETMSARFSDCFTTKTIKCEDVPEFFDRAYRLGADTLILDAAPDAPQKGMIPTRMMVSDRLREKYGPHNRIMGGLVSYAQAENLCWVMGVKINLFTANLLLRLMDTNQSLLVPVDACGQMEVRSSKEHGDFIPVYADPLSVSSQKTIRVNSLELLQYLRRYQMIAEPETLHVILPKDLTQLIF